MKTEDFDDAIRNKFESINQKYDDREIENVYNYVKQNFHLPFWKTYGIKILYTSGIAAMSGLLIWNIVQHKENKILSQTIDSIKNNPVILQTEAINAKPDTVFITKYVYVAANKETAATGNSTNKPENLPIINSINNKVSSIQNNEKQNSGKTNVQPSYANNISPDNLITQAESPKGEELSLFASNSYVGQETNQNTISENPKNQGTASNYQNNGKEPDSIIKTIPIKNEENNNIGIETTNNSIPDSSETENTNLMTKHIAHNSSLLADATKQIKSSISEAKNSLRSDPAPSQISLKYLHYRFGLGLEKANRQMGANLLGEILLSKRWGLSTGVKFLSINNETYNDANDFHIRKGIYFDRVYENQILDTSNVLNIGMRDFLIQIPVTLNYQLPLKNNFALLLGIGTDVDIHAKQFVNFDHHDDPNSLITKNFQTNIPVSAFNNLVISPGIQKRWGHYVLQVRPFISPQLKSVVYKKEDAYFGIKCNFLFSTEE